MEDVSKWFAENWQLISLVVGAVFSVAWLVVRATSNKIDDLILAILEGAWRAVPAPDEPEEGSDASDALPGTGESLLAEGSRENLLEPEDAEPADLRLRR